MTATAVERGQVHWVALDPVRGSEIAKTRPCVILSANEINSRRKTVVIVPLTSTPQTASFPLLVAVPSAGVNSKVRPDQIRCIDKTRLLGVMGCVSDGDLNLIADAVSKVLGLH